MQDRPMNERVSEICTNLKDQTNAKIFFEKVKNFIEGSAKPLDEKSKVQFDYAFQHAFDTAATGENAEVYLQKIKIIYDLKDYFLNDQSFDLTQPQSERQIDISTIKLPQDISTEELKQKINAQSDNIVEGTLGSKEDTISASSNNSSVNKTDDNTNSDASGSNTDNSSNSDGSGSKTGDGSTDTTTTTSSEGATDTTTTKTSSGGDNTSSGGSTTTNNNTSGSSSDQARVIPPQNQQNGQGAQQIIGAVVVNQESKAPQGENAQGDQALQAVQVARGQNGTGVQASQEAQANQGTNVQGTQPINVPGVLNLDVTVGQVAEPNQRTNVQSPKVDPSVQAKAAEEAKASEQAKAAAEAQAKAAEEAKASEQAKAAAEAQAKAAAEAAQAAAQAKAAEAKAAAEAQARAAAEAAQAEAEAKTAIDAQKNATAELEKIRKSEQKKVEAIKQKIEAERTTIAIDIIENKSKIEKYNNKIEQLQGKIQQHASKTEGLNSALENAKAEYEKLKPKEGAEEKDQEVQKQERENAQKQLEEAQKSFNEHSKEGDELQQILAINKAEFNELQMEENTCSEYFQTLESLASDVNVNNYEAIERQFNRNQKRYTLPQDTTSEDLGADEEEVKVAENPAIKQASEALEKIKEVQSTSYTKALHAVELASTAATAFEKAQAAATTANDNLKQAHEAAIEASQKVEEAKAAADKAAAEAEAAATAANKVAEVAKQLEVNAVDAAQQALEAAEALNSLTAAAAQIQKQLVDQVQEAQAPKEEIAVVNPDKKEEVLGDAPAPLNIPPVVDDQAQKALDEAVKAYDNAIDRNEADEDADYALLGNAILMAAGSSLKYESLDENKQKALRSIIDRHNVKDNEKENLPKAASELVEQAYYGYRDVGGLADYVRQNEDNRKAVNELFESRNTDQNAFDRKIQGALQHELNQHDPDNGAANWIRGFFENRVAGIMNLDDRINNKIKENPIKAAATVSTVLLIAMMFIPGGFATGLLIFALITGTTAIVSMGTKFGKTLPGHVLFSLPALALDAAMGTARGVAYGFASVLSLVTGKSFADYKSAIDKAFGDPLRYTKKLWAFGNPEPGIKYLAHEHASKVVENTKDEAIKKVIEKLQAIHNASPDQYKEKLAALAIQNTGLVSNPKFTAALQEKGLGSVAEANAFVAEQAAEQAAQVPQQTAAQGAGQPPVQGAGQPPVQGAGQGSEAGQRPEGLPQEVLKQVKGHGQVLQDGGNADNAVRPRKEEKRGQGM